MRDDNVLMQQAESAGLSLRPSKTNPNPLTAFRAISYMDMPFILGGAPCPGHRYSFMGAAPFMGLALAEDGSSIELKDAPPEICGLLIDKDTDAPLTVLSKILKTLDNKAVKGPFPFNGGAVGFFSYDLGRLLFNLPPTRPDKNKKKIGLPLIKISFYENIYVYDHKKERGYIVSRSPEKKSAKEFHNRIEKATTTPGKCVCLQKNRETPLTSNTTREEYIQSVSMAKDYIADGDIYQINLSQRLTAPYAASPFDLYEGLIQENPTPFSSFFDFGKFQIISNSPERLLKVRGQDMETCPIKGTRPRGATPAEDKKLIKKLAANIKERAEHVMIVDLERNDLSRVAMPGSVYVENFEEIKSFSKLHHMVSTIRGLAPKGTDPMLILKNIFPGGSITGAPKIRAMEIIEELEDVPREVYTGGAGYIDFSGDMDLSILIRTAITKDKRLYLHVGGGIVTDSDPLSEYEETILKAMDFLSLLEMRPQVLR